MIHEKLFVKCKKALNELVNMIPKEKCINSNWNNKIIKLKEIVLNNFKEDKIYRYCNKCNKKKIKYNFIYCPYCGERKPIIEKI